MTFTRTIQHHGYKITTPRKAIATWIEKRKGVFSVNEILSDVSHIDRVSVYRTIELFEQLDLIHPVLTRHGEIHYEKHATDCHHHAVCNKCEKTVCVQQCMIPIKKIEGFSQIHHTLVFTGLCTACT